MLEIYFDNPSKSSFSETFGFEVKVSDEKSLKPIYAKFRNCGATYTLKRTWLSVILAGLLIFFIRNSLNDDQIFYVICGHLYPIYTGVVGALSYYTFRQPL